jgi:hypothetical protein
MGCVQSLFKHPLVEADAFMLRSKPQRQAPRCRNTVLRFGPRHAGLGRPEKDRNGGRSAEGVDEFRYSVDHSRNYSAGIRRRQVQGWE